MHLIQSTQIAEGTGPGTPSADHYVSFSRTVVSSDSRKLETCRSRRRSRPASRNRKRKCRVSARSPTERRNTTCSPFLKQPTALGAMRRGCQSNWTSRKLALRWIPFLHTIRRALNRLRADLALEETTTSDTRLHPHPNTNTSSKNFRRSPENLGHDRAEALGAAARDHLVLYGPRGFGGLA
jgi:hypothetical protein